MRTMFSTAGYNPFERVIHCLSGTWIIKHVTDKLQQLPTRIGRWWFVIKQLKIKLHV
jgi:hypothetical protein